MAAIDTLHEHAQALGLVVLLEHPGDRCRFAVQTSRARVRAGDEWYRRFVAMTEPTRAQMDAAARLLLPSLRRRRRRDENQHYDQCTKARITYWGPPAVGYEIPRRLLIEGTATGEAA